MRASAWLGIAATLGLAAGSMGGCNHSPVEPSPPPAPTAIAAPTIQGAGHCERQHPDVGAKRLDAAREGGAVALAQLDGKTIAYTADEDARALQTIDVTSGTWLGSTPLPGAPAQVLVLDDGRVAVTLRSTNRLMVLEPGAAASAPLTPLCKVQTPVEPVGLASTPDGRTLLVTTAWARQLSAFDTQSLKHRFNVELQREPRDVVVDEDGSRAFVAHVVGGAISIVDLQDDRHEVRPLDLRVKLANGSKTSGNVRQGCQGFALAKSPSIDLAAHKLPAGRIYVPRVTIDPGEPARKTTGYGSNSAGRVESPIVNVVDSAAERNLTTALMRAPGRKLEKGVCLLPRSARVSASSGGLLVACAGNDILIEMDPRGVDPARLQVRRWKVPAGPLGVAVDDANGTAVVWSQFDRKLAVIDLQRANDVRTVTAPDLRSTLLSPEARLGRALFHKTDDPRISRDGRACASCHPDGREDALTWSTPVGPRQTIMLAGRVSQSAPYSWLGAHESVEVHVKATFERLGGRGFDDTGGSKKELAALLSYVRSMPGPNLTNAMPTPHASLAARGKALFFAEAGCARCHDGGRGTDRSTHQVAAMAAGDSKPEFDTPSLRFVAGTAPYFHDGRFATLMDVLTTTDAQMGHTMHLPRRDALALAAYLETL